MRFGQICDRIIEISFYLLFFLVPLIMTKWNYELFEYNKMTAVYLLTTIIAGSWLIKMVVEKRIIFKKTPLDIPILIFLVSQFLSFFFSIDRHVSLWGYYSRFNGGLLSIISYVVLYYSLVSNFDQKKIINLLKFSLASAFVVSVYGILEHFGIDKDVWVQDVQNRVFSTLGQPNWLAAYLAIIIPLPLTFLFISKQQFKTEYFTFYLLAITFYITLLFTKSRSGLLAFGATYILFWLLMFWQNRNKIKAVSNPFFLLTFSFLLFSLIIGTPWTPKFQDLVNRRVSPAASTKTAQPTGPALETGGTESGEIRKIVWKGALDIARHYPLFGSGVETFAFSYYQFRPASHNLVSEWDFLYNKAHNEYLNYAATTGFVGLGSYLLFICTFVFWSLKQLKIQGSKFKIAIKNAKLTKDKLSNFDSDFALSTLNFALLTGWLSILITNFFGFSVVIVALYFYLIPAIIFVLNTENPKLTKVDTEPLTNFQKAIVFVIIFSALYFIFVISKFWYADKLFNTGYKAARSDGYQEAYEYFHKAIALNPNEPFFRDESAYPTVILAAAAWEQKETTMSGELADKAIEENKIALTTSPFNVSFWKTRTKIFYTLAMLDGLPKKQADQYNQEALESLLTAQKLAPTDPKITYNTALLYSRLGNNNMAVKTLEEAVKLKPNYQDARFALALFYNETGKRQEAIRELQYILTKINPGADDIRKKLQDWGVQ